jgi:hypothetical protein
MEVAQDQVGRAERVAEAVGDGGGHDCLPK